MPNVELKNKKGIPIEYSNVDNVVVPDPNGDPVSYSRLPEVDDSDNGKVLGVVNGDWDKLNIGPGISYQVVNQLPQEGEVGVIYLVPIEGSTNDVYDEYLWVNNAFEKIGTTEIHNNAVCFTFDVIGDGTTLPPYEATDFSMSGQEILDALAEGKFVYGMSSGSLNCQWINSYYAEDSYAEFTAISGTSSYNLTVTANTTTSSTVSIIIIDLQGPQGEPGQDGQDGQNGQDGAPGANGQDGLPGSVFLSAVVDNSFDITEISDGTNPISFGGFLFLMDPPLSLPIVTVSVTGAYAGFSLQNMLVDINGGEPIGKIIFRCDSVDKSGLVTAVNAMFPGKFPDDTTSLDIIWEREYDSGTDTYVETLSWSPIRSYYALDGFILPTNYPVINYAILTTFQTWMNSAVQSPGTVVSASDPNVSLSDFLNEVHSKVNQGYIPGLVISDGTNAWQMVITGGGFDATTGDPQSASGKLIADYTISGVGDFLLDVNLVIKPSEIVIYGYAISK